MTLLRKILVLFLLLASISHCGGAVPPQASTEKSIIHYMASYGKKFPGSAFAENRITKVDLYSLSAIKKNYASAVVFLTGEKGGLYQAAFTLKHEPFGWKVASFEILQGP